MRDTAGSRPVPDPTELTDKAIAKAIAAERDYVIGQLAVISERINGIDTATDLRLLVIDALPARIVNEVTHLELLHEEKFKSIETRFAERDMRAERESRDNKVAVDAAFAAQKESAAQENRNNQKAIDKSEAGTAEKIDKLSELFSTTIKALDDKIDDLKDRTRSIEATKNGATENRTSIYATVAVIGSVIVASIAVIGLAIKVLS
jgi:hypothetical protein